MKYFNETITNREKEIDFLKIFIKKMQDILGTRIVLIQQTGKAYIKGNDMIPTNTPSEYSFSIILDNKLTLLINRISSSDINGYSFKINALSDASALITYTNSGTLDWNATGIRSLTIKGVQTTNLLILSFVSNPTNTPIGQSFNLIVLQNSETYGAALKISTGDTLYSSISNNFPTNLIFNEITQLDDISSGNTFSLVNRFPYNYNYNLNSKQTEIRKGKVAIIPNTQTRFTTFLDLYDTSIVPTGLFITINDLNYIALNSMTLVCISNNEETATKIKVVVNPNITEYNKDDVIDFTGIKVCLYNDDDTLYISSAYPTGEIPFRELVFPMTTAVNTLLYETNGICWAADSEYLVDTAGDYLGTISHRGQVRRHRKIYDGGAICVHFSNVENNRYTGIGLYALTSKASLSTDGINGTGVATACATSSLFPNIQFYSCGGFAVKPDDNYPTVEKIFPEVDFETKSLHVQQSLDKVLTAAHFKTLTVPVQWNNLTTSFPIIIHDAGNGDGSAV